MTHKNNTKKPKLAQKKPLSIKLSKIATAIRNIALASSVATAPGIALADPVNGSIGHDSGGGSSITPTVGHYVIDQTGNSLYIDWTSFDVANNEVVTFNQPNSTAVALNNISGGGSTTIAGTINANGRVFLINPDGIVFGSTASINVNGLIASSLLLSEANFAAGNYVFTDGGQKGNVTNEGILTAGEGGFITLLGHDVSNAAGASILATKSQANLISAEQVTFNFSQDGLLQFTVDQAVAEATAVSNAGTINATDGWVVMSAQSADTIIANTVNNTGILTATGVDTSNGDVYLVGGNGSVGLGQVNAELLNVSTSGHITSSDVLNVSGNTTLNSSSGYSISVNNAGNNFGNLSLTGVDATVTTGSGVNLSGASLSGHLSLTSNGTITDSGTVSVGGVTTLITGNNSTIRLDEAANDFATITIGSTGDSVILNDINDITLASVDATNLIVATAGNISQSADLTVSGNANFTATGADVLLNTGTNNFGRLSLTGVNAVVTEASSTALSGATLTGNLDLTSSGAITDFGAINVSGITTLSTGNGASIALNDGSNDFASVTVTSTGDSVELVDANSVILGAINATDLAVTALGNITQSDALTTSGNASFNGASVLLNTATNNFGSLALTGVNATVIEDSATDLSGASLSGNLNLTSAGAISDSGRVSVAGTATLNTGNGLTIALNDVSNDFGTVIVSSIGDSVELVDANAVILGAINSTDLIVSATGNISQSGVLTTSGNARFSGADVFLNTHTNDFGSLTLTGVNAAVVEGSSTDLSAVSLSGSLDLTSTGAITDSGTVNVAGVATLNTNNNSTIALNEASNDFGTVTVTSTGDSIELIDTNAVILGAINSTDLIVTATGDINQSGALTTFGNARFTGADVLLHTSTNNFGSLTLTAVNAAVVEGSSTDLSGVSLSGNFDLTSTGAITDSGTVNVAGVTTLNTNNNSTIALNEASNDFATVAVTSTGDSIELIDTNSVILGVINSTNLIVSATGNISQSGALTTSGNARFTGADVLLNTSTNNFGSLTLAAVNAAVVEGSSTDLSGITLGGNFDLTSAGAITDSGTVDVAGITTLSTGNGSSITLNEASNDFATVAVTSTGDSIELIDTNSVILGAINSSDLIVSTTGNISQSGALTTSGNASFTGADVALNTSTNNFGSLTLTAVNAAVAEGSSTDLSGITLGGNFDLTSAGAITDSGTVDVAGITTLSTGNGSSIALNEASNDFATVTVTSTGDSIELIDTNSVILGAINSSDLIVSATGNISQSGALTTSGNASFTGADVLLNTQTNNFGSLALTGVNAAVREGSSTDLSGVTLSGNFDLTSAGAITDSVTVNVTGTTTLNTGNGSSITLDDGNSDFATVAVTSTDDSIELIDTNSVILGAINSSDLIVSATGNISQSSALTTSGNASFSGADVSLSSHTNNFGSLALTGVNAAVREGSSTDLSGVSLSGSLSLTSTGAITDSGTVNVAGVTTLNTNNGSTIALNDASNDFATVAVTSTGDSIELIDTNAVVLGAINSSDLIVTATGNISQSGALTTSGNARFTGTDVLLNTQTNHFGSLALTGVNAAVIEASSTELSGVSLSGSLDLTSTGAITDSGTVNVAGVATLNTNNNSTIALNDASNDFGTVTVTSTGDSIELIDTNAVILGAINSTNLIVSATGNISQSGALTTSGNASFSGTDVSLSSQTNNFGGLALTGANATITEASSTDLTSVSLSGNLDLTSSGAITDSGTVRVTGITTLNTGNGSSIALNDASNDFGSVAVTSIGDSVELVDASGVILGAMTSNSLTVSSAGDITNSGALVISGTSAFNNGSGTAITLDNAGNDFVDVTVTGSGGTVTLVDSNGIDLGAITASHLAVTTAGNMTNSGALVIAGTTTLNSGAGTVITLNNAGNDFATVAGSADAVTLVDSNGIDLGPMNAASLTVTTAGDITNSGALVVSGTTTLDNGVGSAISLNDAANNFGTVTINGSGDAVTLVDADGIILGGMDLSSLDVTAAGNITQSGALVVSGNTQLSSNNGQLITLDNASNNFATVSVGSTGDSVTLRDADSIILGAINAANLDVIAAGNISQSDGITTTGNASFAATNINLNTHTNDFLNLSLSGVNATVTDNSSTNLSAANLTGDLTLTSAGDITDSGPLVVSGTTTLSSGNLITLDSAANDFATVTVASTGNTVVLNDINTVNLGPINASSLTVSAGTNITQSGDLTAVNQASFNAADVTLNNGINNFGTLVLTGTNATVTENSSTDLSGVSLSGALTLTSAGDISNSAAVSVAGLTRLNNGVGTQITLDHTDNDFGTVTVVGTGDAVVLHDSNTIDLGSIDATDLTVSTAAGNITQSDDLTVSNNASFSAVGADVLLNTHTNRFANLALAANTATVSDSGDTNLNGVTATTLNLASTGNITDSAAVVVTGVSTFGTAGGGLITLNDAGNNFGSVIISSVNDAVVLSDSDGIDLGQVNAANLQVSTHGGITSSGALTIAGTTTLNTGNNQTITLDNANNFNALSVTSTGDSISINDINAIDLGRINAANLTVTAATTIRQSDKLSTTGNANFTGLDLILDTQANSFANLALTATNASVTETGDINLNGVAVTNLTLVAGGTITDSAAVVATGTTTLTSAGNSLITLDHADNNFATVSVLSNGDEVVLNDSNGIDLAAINAASLSVTANGAITGSGALTVAGTTTLNTGNNQTITLNNANDFNTLTVSSTGDSVTLNDINGVNLATLSAADLTVTAVGNISQSGNLNVTNNASFSAADVSLNQTNNFGSLALTANNATVTEADDTDLNGVNVTNLSLTSGGAISDSKAMVVTGTASLTGANGAAIVLDHTANNFSTVTIGSTGNDVTLDDVDGIDLGAMDVASLNLSTNGGITNSGALSISGALTLATGNNASIILDDADNDFTTVSVTSTGDTVVLNDKNAINLAGLDVAKLSVTSAGDITDSGALVVSGLTTLQNSGSVITLDHAGNNFATVSVISSGNNVELNDTNGIDLAAMNAASLKVTANGAITDSGALIVAGTTTLNTSNNQTITLDNDNDFASVTITSTGDSVVLKDINMIDLGAMNVASLSLTTGGAITDSGTLVVSGALNLATNNGSSITLDDSDNDFDSVTVNSIDDSIVLVDKNALGLAAMTAKDLSVTAGGNITQSGNLAVTENASFTGADVNLTTHSNNFGSLALFANNASVTAASSTDLSGATINGNLTLTSAGNIIDSGAVVVTGTTTLNSGNGKQVTLDHSGNDFGTVAIASTGDTVVINDSTGLDLGAMNAASLNVTAGGAITDSGALVVSGLTTLNSGNNAAVTLDNVGNNFSSVTVSSTGNSVVLNDLNEIELGTINAASLTVSSAGNISQSGALTTSNNASFSTTNGDILLNTQTNQFGGLALTGSNATVIEADSTDLTGAMLSGTLALTSSGNISDSGAVMVAGLTTLNTGNGGSIALDHANNNFATVTVASTGDSVVLTDLNTIDLGVINSADLTVTAGTNITQSGDLTTLNNASFSATAGNVNLTTQTNNFGSLALSAVDATVTEASDTNLSGVTANTLTLSSAGNITDSGAVTVAGVATLTTGNNGLITLDSAGNNFATVAITSTGDSVVLNDSDGIDLGAMNIASLNVTAAGNITDSGALVVAGQTTLNSGNGALITLDNAANDFTTVTVASTADTVVLNDINAFDLTGINAAGLTVTAAGDITQSGSFQVSGDASFNAGTADVLLNTHSNNFGTLALTANNANVTEADSTMLNGVNIASSLTLTSADAISDSAAVVVAGTSILSSGNNAAITLDHAANDFGTVGLSSIGNAVTLTDSNSINLGDLNAASLNISAVGAIADVGTLVVSGLTTLNSGNNQSIQLDSTSNDFASVSVTSTGDSVVLNDINAIEFSAITAADLTVNVNGNITQSGDLNVTNNASFSAGLADITLNSHSNNFGTLTLAASNAAVSENSSIDLKGATIGADLTLSAAGNITDEGAVLVAGVTTLNTGNAAAITLDDAGNDFTRIAVTSSADTIVLNDINAIELGAMNAAALSVTATTNITDSGAIVVAGATTLSGGDNAQIILDDVGNDFATLSVTSTGGTVSGSVVVNDINAIELASINAATLDVTAGTTISQSGDFNVSDHANFSGSELLLNSHTNNFGSLSLNATNAQVTEASSTDLTAVTITNDFTLTSVGQISDSGSVNVAGLTTLSGTLITLDSVTNDFGTVAVTGAADTVTLVDINAIDLGPISATNLLISAGGDISDSGNLLIADFLQVSGDKQATIVLDQAGNNFNRFDITSTGNSVTVVDVDGIELAALTAADLSVTAGGNITQSGDLSISNNASFTGVAADVLLNTHNNTFGSLSLNANNATVAAAASIDLREAAIASDLTLTSVGNITDSGNITVTGLTRLNSGNNATIALDSAGNNFTTVSVGSTGDAVTLVDVDHLDLAAINAASLNVSTGGLITDSGNLVVSGLTILDSGNDQSITLDEAGNDFATVSVTSSGDVVTLTDVNAIELGALTAASLNVVAAGDITQSGVLQISDNATFTTAAADVLLNTQTNNFGNLSLTAVNAAVTEGSSAQLNGITTSGAFTLTAVGDITDTAAMTVAGVTSLNTGNNAAIVLDEAGNNFTTVAVASSGDTVSLVDSNAVNLAAANAQDLTVVAAGNITQSGALQISNNASFTATGADISLNTQGNNFANLLLNANNATLATAGNTNLSAATIAGDLSLTSAGSITDSGIVSVSGSTTLNSGNNSSIVLDGSNNDFSTVTVTSSGDTIVLNDVNALDLGAINAASLDVVANGNISDSGTLTVAGLTRLSTGNNSAITLDQASNNFATLTVASIGDTVTLNDINGIVLGGMNTTALAVNAGGTISQSGAVVVNNNARFTTATANVDLNTSNNNFGSLTITANNAAITEGSSTNLAAVNLNGNLTLTAAGNISDSGTVTVAGITSLNSGNNASVILDSASNNFSTLAVVSTGDTVVVNDVDSIVLGTLNATDLTVTAAADISQSGNLNVANNASFTTSTDVLLNTASNNFGSLLIAARGAQINEADATDLSSVNLSGDLTLTSTGAITDSGNVTVQGNTILDTGGDSAITLDNSSNDFSVVTIASVGDAVTLSDINTLDFGSLNAASLNVTTAGDISDSGTVVVAGETLLNSGDNANIVFDDDATDFGSVTIASTGDTVVLNDINVIELGGMASDSLSVNAAGDISQSGELQIDSNASFTSTGEVLLNDNNNFGTLSLTAVTAQITEASGADLNGVNLEGDFSLTAAGDITSDGAIVVGGITTLDSGNDGAITLDDAENDFASITITSTGDAVVLNDINAIDLAAINAASLNVSSDGAITSSGALVIAGDTSLNSGNDQLITLDHVDNDFNSLNIASTGDTIVINNINAIELATINAAALDVTAGGDISQSGDVSVTDHASFTATNADVLLDSQTNNFGSLSLTANNASVTEASDTDLTVVTIATNLSIRSNGKISGRDITSVGQNTLLSTGDNSTITLNNAANDFATVTITSTGDTVQLTDVNAIDLGAMDTASLSVNAQGNITDSGGVIVAGVATLNSGNNALITLDDAANDFNSVAIESSGDTVIINDINGIALATLNATAIDVTAVGDISQSGDFTVTGNASFTASNANVLLNTQTNNFGSLSLIANQAVVNEASSTDLASVLVSDLRLTTAGDITDSGTLKVTGLTTLDSGDGKVITLDGSDNDFNTVTVLSTGDNVTLNDINAIDLGAMNVASLDLKTAGNISDSGVVAVSGLTTLATGNNASITLDQANDFNTVVVASSGDSVVLNDVDGIELGSITAAGLNVTAGGDISQSGNLAVSGDAAFITPTADVQLSSNNNTFGTLAITAINATVDEDDDTVLNGVAISNDLRLTSSGSIDDTAAVTIGGLTWLKSDRDITLNQIGNDFNAVTVTSTGNAVTLSDSNEIELGAMNVASLTVTSAGSITNTGVLQVSGVTSLNTGNDSQITLDGENDFATVTIASSGDTVVINDINAIDLGVMNANTLDITAVGNITQSGALLVSNNANFASQADLVLGDNSNNFGDLTLSANDATVSEGSAMTLTDVTATNLTLSAAGDITDTGKLLVSGVTTLNSGNNGQIILDGSENNLGTVALSSTGDTVVLNDVDAIELGAMNASSLSVTATGDITQTADALVIGANANFNTAANVTLNSNNQFGNLTLTANNASVTAADAIDLNGVTVTNLTLASGDAISDSGTLLVSGVATLGSGNNAAITLDDASNNFGTVTVNTQGNAVTLNDVDTIELGQITAASLNVTAVNDITQTANLVIGGNANFTTATDVTLSGANQFGTVSVSANNVTLTESGDAELTAVVVAGDLSLTTSGDITDSGIVSVAGITNLNSGNGAAITLDNAGNDFSTVIVTSTADAITLNDSNTLDLGAINAASLNVTTAGAITDSGTLLVSGVTTLNSGGNSAITLDDAANNFATVTVASNGDSVLLNDVDGITLGQIAAADLSVNAAGEISQSGNLTVTNGATFTSQAAVLLNTNNNDFGNLTVTADSASINEQSATQLNGITINNDLTVTSGSDISQSENESVTVGGNASFIAATGDVVLNSNANDFGSLSVTAINATIDENSSTSLNGVTVTADLTLNSTADITQVANSAIDVAGNANFITVADVTLNSGANIFGSISANANNITISETDGSDLNGITALTDFNLNSGANINQTAASAIEVGSNASLTTANNITLDGSGNNFGSLTLAAVDASIVENSDTVLDAVAVANLTLTSVGNISQTDSSGIAVSGNANFNTPADVILANIIANNAGNSNSFGSLTINAANATIEEADSSELNGIEISANFSLTAGGDIIQTDGGNINVAGNAGFAATGDVTLASNNNTFGSLSLDAVNATIDEDDATELNNVTVNGEFVLASAGDITQTVVPGGQARTIDQLAQGQVNVTGSATFTTASDVVLANSINDFGSLTLTATNATISEASDSVLNAINVTNLTINAQGDISQTAAIAASGVTTLNSGNGNTITLTDATNDFGTLSVVSTGDTVSVVDSNTLDLGLITSADLTITAQDISQSNDVTVVGDITLAANNTVALTNVNATGNIAVRTETAGISTNGTVTSGGTLELDSNTAISANGALTAGGSITLAASDGDIAVTTVAGDTVDIVALRGNVTGSQIHATATTEGESANMQILAVQVGDGDGLELLVETGAATVAVGNINSTALVDNQESRTLLVQVFDSAAIDTARTATAELITSTLSNSTSQGNTAAGIAATDAGRSSEVVEVKEDTLSGDESDYITPDPSVELPADQKEEDEFADGDDE